MENLTETDETVGDEDTVVYLTDYWAHENLRRAREMAGK
jgi:calcineurin-like phosphoesterase family protein